MVKHFVSLFIATVSFSCMASEKLMDAILHVGPGGLGNEKVIEHWNLIETMDASDLIKLFNLMNKANDLGDNWIRAAVSQIIDRSDDTALPQNALVEFIENIENSGSARREAFDLLNSTSSQTSQSLVPGFIDDPEPSLRREGVELLIEQAAELKNQAQSIEAYEYALSKAREVDQIEKVCKSLKSLGKTIDIQKLMGFIINWEITGPFQNKERKGFAVAYPPEISTETYPSKDLTWQTIATSDPFGLIDLNQHLGFVKEVLCYAKADFDSPVAQKVHFRIGSKNAWKLWVNDKMIFARDEYHRGGTRVDQFVLAGNLIKGSNRILVKVCQNEQTQSWTKQWEFCFRITDPTGKPIQSTK